MVRDMENVFLSAESAYIDSAWNCAVLALSLGKEEVGSSCFAIICFSIVCTTYIQICARLELYRVPFRTKITGTTQGFTKGNGSTLLALQCLFWSYSTLICVSSYFLHVGWSFCFPPFLHLDFVWIIHGRRVDYLHLTTQLSTASQINNGIPGKS